MVGQSGRQSTSRNRRAELPQCQVDKEVRTIILHLTIRKRDSSICPSGTTTKGSRANGPFLRGSRCICIPETVGGPALGKPRPRLTGRPLLPCRAFRLQKGVQVRITRRRPRGTVQSGPSIRKRG